MKKQSLRIFLMFGLLSLLAMASAHAQTNTEQRAHISFSFTVGNRTFPAGDYRVLRLNPVSDQAALAIKSMDGRWSVITLTRPIEAARPQEKAKLIFSRYGDQYFLSQVWTPAESRGLELPPARAEKALARNALKREPEQVMVALSSHRR